jgi:hypothetical protein
MPSVADMIDAHNATQTDTSRDADNQPTNAQRGDDLKGCWDKDRSMAWERTRAYKSSMKAIAAKLAAAKLAAHGSAVRVGGHRVRGSAVRGSATRGSAAIGDEDARTFFQKSVPVETPVETIEITLDEDDWSDLGDDSPVVAAVVAAPVAAAPAAAVAVVANVVATATAALIRSAAAAASVAAIASAAAASVAAIASTAAASAAAVAATTESDESERALQQQIFDYLVHFLMNNDFAITFAQAKNLAGEVLATNSATDLSSIEGAFNGAIQKAFKVLNERAKETVFEYDVSTPDGNFGISYWPDRERVVFRCNGTKKVFHLKNVEVFVNGDNVMIRSTTFTRLPNSSKFQADFPLSTVPFGAIIWREGRVRVVLPNAGGGGKHKNTNMRNIHLFAQTGLTRTGPNRVYTGEACPDANWSDPYHSLVPGPCKQGAKCTNYTLVDGEIEWFCRRTGHSARQTQRTKRTKGTIAPATVAVAALAKPSRQDKKVAARKEADARAAAAAAAVAPATVAVAALAKPSRQAKKVAARKEADARAAAAAAAVAAYAAAATAIVAATAAVAAAAETVHNMRVLKLVGEGQDGLNTLLSV